MATCCSINMRIFKTSEMIFYLLFIVSSCFAAPGFIESSSNESNESNEYSESSESAVHYDQRQNGTENFRVHIDGLAVVVMPVEALLLAGALADGDDSNVFGISGAIGDKPTKPEVAPEIKPQADTDLSELKPQAVAKPETEPETIKDKHIHQKSSHKAGLRLMSLLAPLLKRAHAHH